MEAWPGALPQHALLEGYDERPANVGIRTDMDAGPAKQRRRYTAGPRPVTASVLCRSDAQHNLLHQFFTATLKGGVEPFEWHDRTGAPLTFRFVVGPDALKSQPLGGGLWRVDMQLEILP